MSIRTRLITSLALLFLSILAVAGAGLFALNAASDKTRSIVVDRVEPLQQLKLVADAYAVNIVDTAHKVGSGELDFAAGQASVATALEQIEASWSHYGRTSMTSDEAALLQAAQTSMEAAAAPMAELQRILNASDKAALEAFADNALYPAIDPIGAAISDLIDLQTRVAVAEYESAVALRNLSLMVMGVIGVISLGIFGYALSVVLRGVIAPLHGMQDVMGRMADGDYTSVVPFTDNSDEIGAMAKAVEVFRENGLRVQNMTAEEKLAEAGRQRRMEMMQSLQAAFGQVVGAAAVGDFSRRVDPNYDDDELNTLGRSVDSLVSTVERGLSETGTVLAAMAQADLTRRVVGEGFEGAFARLRDDTNAVGDKLTAIVGELRSTSRALKVATGEILSGANDLSERTTKQAATIEETSAAMEQLAATVAQNARQAGDASVKTQSATRTAEEGGEVMGQATLAMERIQTSSEKISNIIGLIDDIAFQTNLLALNASVEAARAGEAGKGFAVVAVEVRRLAQSAAEASKEVKVLIDESGSEVRDGSRLVADAAGKLDAILQAVRENSAIMDAISRASTEQAGGIEEVNVAVRQMDEMTQHNAALVEETNAAIEQTEAQASELDRIVAIFALGDTPPQAASRPEPKAAVAKRYLSQGNAALKADWSEF